MGRWEEASKKASEALTLAHQQSHTYSLAVTIANVCNVHVSRGDWLALQRQADAGVLLCTEQGFASILEQFRMYRAYAMVRQGEKDGIAQLAEALAAYRATGTARTALNYLGFLTYLADACWAAAHFKEGLDDAIAEAFELIELTGERLYEAQLYRLKGELMLNHSRGQRLSASIQQLAEECFRKSLEIARRQAARSFELSAATSLARLLRDTGRREEARTMLAEIYEQFTEGFDTAVLEDAKALLDELSNSAR